MNRLLRRLALPLVLCLTLAAAGCGSEEDASASGGGENKVRIAAASDLQAAMEDIADAFEAQEPDIDVSTTYGSSGTFFTQLSNGAPFDMYLSADITYADQLVEAGKADEADVFRYAVGRLVLWASNDSPIDVEKGLAGLDTPDLQKLSIANPEHAPYGVAAVAAMEKAGVYDAVEDKLVLGENVSQAAEFASSGNAQAGVIALSLALTPELQERGSYTEIPLESYPTIDQGGVVMSDAGDPEAARALADFLTSDEGEAILEEYGFYLPTS